jgi:hypothetical protein
MRGKLQNAVAEATLHHKLKSIPPAKGIDYENHQKVENYGGFYSG